MGGGCLTLENTNRRNGVTANLTDAELIELDALREKQTRSSYVRDSVIARMEYQKKHGKKTGGI